MGLATLSAPTVGPALVTQLQEKVHDILREAPRQGAQHCEAVAQLLVRREATTLGESRPQPDHQVSLGLAVYREQRRGEISINLASGVFDAGALVSEALSAASAASADVHVGLADAESMAYEYPELDLYHETGVDLARMGEFVQVCEQAGLDSDSRIVDSRGTSLTAEQGCRVHGNSHGFLGSYAWTEYALSCYLRASAAGETRTGNFQETQRRLEALTDYAAAGRKAAAQGIGFLGGQTVAKGSYPVLFAPEAAVWLLVGFIQGITGSSLVGDGTFLKKALGKPLFGHGIAIQENPHAPGALGSVPYDSDGVKVTDRTFVEDGHLISYALDAVSARRLSLANTGNGVANPFEVARNLSFAPGMASQEALCRQMDRGILVAQARAPQLDLRSGAFTQRAIGYWVEGGVVQHPLAPFQMSGRLGEVFGRVVAVANDQRAHGRVFSGSVLVEGMQVG